MAVKLRLTRMGRRNRPFFRLNAVDSRTPRDGKIIEKLGHYDPIEKDVTKQIELPFTLPAQSGNQATAPKSSASSWADDILKHEGYVIPPPELAEAVMAPRWQNISLSDASPDKKWFLNQIGDGPVPMKTFSKPFDELGGVFIDFKANRARSLTISRATGRVSVGWARTA